MVVVNPHQYEKNLSLVRAMTDDLGDVATVGELVDEYERRADLLQAAVNRLDVAMPSPDVAPLLIDSAFQGRHRELPGERQQTEAAGRIAEAGGIICPASPGFYLRPTTVDELIDFVVGKLLDLLEIEHPLKTRWKPQ